MKEDNTFVIEGLPPLGPIPDVSVGKLIYDKLLSNCSDNEALVDASTGEALSYKTLLIQSRALAEALRRSGYGKDTIITVCSENCIEFFIPVLAALYVSAVLAPINHSYTIDEMIHTLNISKPKIIFCSEQVLPKFLKLKENLTYIEKIILIRSKNCNNGIESCESLINKYSRSLHGFRCSEVISSNQLALILCSSGTTGLPKGVMITHKNILTRFMHNDDPRLKNQQVGRTTFGILPFFHSYGFITSLCSIYREIKIVVLKKFEEDVFLRTIEKYRITSLSLVPPLAIFLAKTPLVKRYDISSLMEVSCGAAPLSKDTEDILKNKLKIKSVRQAYGLTETTIGVMSMPIGHEKFGSSGKILPYIKCKIRDPETGKSLGPNQIGELCFKGSMIMKGYYGDPEATKNAFTSDGWLLTGDLGYYDDEEYFYIVDRLKELIKFKGFQVAPAELEAILLNHPKIRDAAVVGVPNEEAGELPLAFVVANANLSEEEVKQFVAEKVSPQKKLRGGVVFIDEIPKNPSGKIIRRRLKEFVKLQRSKL